MTENSKWKPVGDLAEAAHSKPRNELFSKNTAILKYIIDRDKKSKSSSDSKIGKKLIYLQQMQPIAAASLLKTFCF